MYHAASAPREAPESTLTTRSSPALQRPSSPPRNDSSAARHRERLDRRAFRGGVIFTFDDGPESNYSSPSPALPPSGGAPTSSSIPAQVVTQATRRGRSLREMADAGCQSSRTGMTTATPSSPILSAVPPAEDLRPLASRDRAARWPSGDAALAPPGGTNPGHARLPRRRVRPTRTCSTPQGRRIVDERDRTLQRLS